MENKEINIAFALKKITTEQFAMIEDAFAEGTETNLKTQLRFGIDSAKKVLSVFTTFKFEQENMPFLLLESGCHFKIKENDWILLIENSAKKIIFPLNFVSHLTLISICTARGILHGKTENTVFNKFFLPNIYVNELINKDIEMDI